ERVPLHVLAPCSPEPDRSTRLRIPGLESSLGAPEHQKRADDAPAIPEIRRVVFAIEGGGRPILLADRVDVGGIPERLEVDLLHLARKYGGRRAPVAQRVVDDGFGRRGQKAF